jgi:hypothetical protein
VGGVPETKEQRCWVHRIHKEIRCCLRIGGSMWWYAHLGRGPVGCQNSVTVFDPGLLRSPLVFVEEAAEDGPALDSLLGRAGDGVAGPGRPELAATMGVVRCIGPRTQPGSPRRWRSPKISIPVGDLRPGGEHEPFGAGVRTGTGGRDHHGFEARAGTPVPASNQVNVLVAGLNRRCPCLSAVSPTRPGERTDI